ncbi:hypothetical protein ACFWGE_26150 [Streptomyces bacillaris]|uniref:hypothetical protein n=1 Tax=Streptomyces TaxID=1883 RepID=UPI000DC65AC0|nr:hypothetical protein [Streptomyces cavourensis]ATY97470.1 hypothetical protein CVT27_20030 [Streptomyces cavourensis]TQO32134.1 hypothetical protein FHX79_114007 [Streptomyces cavourensis]GGU82097.1 hypothetical protein GCM10010498_45260 [Streptomyces cavourensis]
MMRRQIKLAAVLVVVVLALTGFSTASSGGKGSKSKGSSSSGGGCSNSKKSNSGYRHNDYGDDDSSSSGSSGSTYGTPTPTASDAPVVRVIRCARPGKGKRKAVTASVVELRSNDTRSHRYEVDVTFLDARGNTVDTAETTTTLDAGDVRSLTVRMDSPRKVSQVSRCEVTAQLL